MAVETKMGAEKPPSTNDGELLPQEFVGGAHGDVFLERSARLSSITKEENLLVCSAWAATLPSFYHQSGNCSVDVISHVEVRHTATAAGAMCALQKVAL